MSAAPLSVDEYLASFAPGERAALEDVRARLLAAIPGAEEKIRYGMPAVVLGGRYAIHFAGWKAHIGLYPVPRLSPELEAEIAPLRTGKDAVAVPLDLVSRVASEIVALRAS